MLALVPLAWLALVALLAQEPPRKLAAIADNCICIHPDERRQNQGAKPVLRVKGIEHVLLLDFELAPIRGRCVEEARLFLHLAGDSQLKILGLSTVASPWNEGASNGEARRGESCFLQAAAGERDWAGPGSDFLAVTYGAGGSIWFARELRSEADGWISVELPPPLLHAMLERNSFGLAVSDEKGQTLHNNDVHSREQSGCAPYVVVARSSGRSAPPSGARRWVAPDVKPVAAVTLIEASEPEVHTPSERFRVLYEGERDRSRPAARLWDGRAITLDAVRGEHVGFEVALDRPGRVGGEGWRVSRVTHDPLEPADEGTLLHVERHVAKDEAPGVKELALRVAGADVPVVLRVHAATLPDRLGFRVSLNTYGTPQPELAFHRLAHEHRATLAVVPYSHHGRVEEGCAPDLVDGRIAWEAWDRRFGPLFDGSAFRGLPRDGAPLDHFYLPFHESWPTPIRSAYSYRGTLADHWRDAPPIEAAFPESYAAAFRAAIAATARHVEEKRWTTDFHVFLNDKNLYWKPDADACWWTLDEPMFRDDFLAIRYFAGLTREGLAAQPGSRLRFRIDLSRPQWRRDLLDGLIGLDVVSPAYKEYPALVFGRGEEVWNYGTASAAPHAWIVQAFLDGCDGVLPWQSIGSEKAWSEYEETALMLARGGEVFPTLRLKLLRRGEQDVELLRLVLERRGLAREQVRAGLQAFLGLSTSPAGDLDRFEAMRRALRLALD